MQFLLLLLQALIHFAKSVDFLFSFSSDLMWTYKIQYAQCAEPFFCCFIFCSIFFDHKVRIAIKTTRTHDRIANTFAYMAWFMLGSMKYKSVTWWKNKYDKILEKRQFNLGIYSWPKQWKCLSQSQKYKQINTLSMRSTPPSISLSHNCRNQMVQ